MRTNRPALAPALAVAASTLLLGGALAFQFVGGLFPCEMCLWQRYPHAAAIGLGLAALAAGVRYEQASRALTLLAALALLTTAGIGLMHVGVEQKWWEGPTACSAEGVAGSTADMLKQLIATPAIRCDEIAWSLFGVSMAGYNLLLSLLAAAGVLWLIRTPRMQTK